MESGSGPITFLVIIQIFSLILAFILKKTTPMFGKFALGFIGVIIVLIGVIEFIMGITQSSSSGVIIGIISIIVGAYMRYLSKQAVTVESITNEPQKQFSGNRTLENETYKLYLVEKYKIKKNETLDKYVFNDEPYSSLEQALEAADKHDK
tara:strand:+ start:181 stop:633 length:453 start_codon:yes stop_codon:yes gene_type:complete